MGWGGNCEEPCPIFSIFISLEDFKKNGFLIFASGYMPLNRWECFSAGFLNLVDLFSTFLVVCEAGACLNFATIWFLFSPTPLWLLCSFRWGVASKCAEEAQGPLLAILGQFGQQFYAWAQGCATAWILWCQRSPDQETQQWGRAHVLFLKSL